MGTWGTGNFANDGALDCAHELVDQMLVQVESAVASECGRISTQDFPRKTDDTNELAKQLRTV